MNRCLICNENIEDTFSNLFVCNVKLCYKCFNRFKFRNDKLGTYKRAIYNSDIAYEAPNHRNNEIEVYVTYKIALKNESTYLGRINNILDYCDTRYDLVAVGYSVDEKDQITNNISFGGKQAYNGSYSKYVINTNTMLSEKETKYIQK